MISRLGSKVSASAVAIVVAGVIVGSFAAWQVFFWSPTAPASQAAAPAPSPRAASPAKTRTPPVKRLVVYGHSIPAGGGATSPERGYAPVAAKALGLPLVNYAHGGDLAVNAASVMDAHPLPRPGDLVLIHIGMNDMLLNGESSATTGEPYVARLLAGASSASHVIVMLECQPRTWEHDAPFNKGTQQVHDDWNAMLRDQAAQWKGVTVLDTCSAWDADKYNERVTNYHPSDAGHRYLAKAVEQVARPWLADA